MTANSREIHVTTRTGLYRDRREGYKFLPRQCWRRDFGRCITQHTAQLAAWYARPGHARGIYNPKPVMIVDYNWTMHPSRPRPVKVLIVIFESGSGFIQFGRGEVRAFYIPRVHLPPEEFSSYEFREHVRLFIRRMIREEQL